MTKRLHAYYCGSVQGIGFRYEVRRTAESLGLAGWVKNLDDGRVELVVEAESSAIDKFLHKIGLIFKDYIKDVVINWDESKDEFQAFEIRFDS